MADLTAKEIADLSRLGFDASLLEYRGNISLPELAEHVARQAGLRVRWAAKAEHSLYNLNVAEDEHMLWYEKKKLKLIRELEEKNIRTTEARVTAEMISRYCTKIREINREIIRLKYESRLLVALVKSIDVKGDMLQSLRNILQDPYLREQVVQGKIKISAKGNKNGESTAF
jgi:hypothetical protein